MDYAIYRQPARNFNSAIFITALYETFVTTKWSTVAWNFDGKKWRHLLVLPLYSAVSLTIEFLESILLREFDQCMSASEIDAFQTAFVLYSMSSFLVVVTPDKTFPKCLLGNLDSPDKICEFNWCSYVLSVLAQSARQVQEQLISGSKFVDIFGCTFLLQVGHL